MSEERFKVHQFFPDDFNECVGENLTAKEAVELAHSYTTRPAAMIGIIRRVIIESQKDESTNFEWRFGEGVVFPPRKTG